MSFEHNRSCKLLGIRYPIVQGGMIWVAGSKLAAAVSNAGGLGLIGAGSMRPELFLWHIDNMKNLTDRPWGVNLPLLYPHTPECLAIALAEGVNIFFTSAGNPKAYTAQIKSHGHIAVHVVATPEQARKCEAAGCDAVVAEGFEAGGHNGPAELTTMVLVPEVVDAVSIPVLAAGGIADGRAMAAAFALGAAGVQVGTRFAVTQESSAHQAYKRAVVEADPTASILTLKELGPVRLLKNDFYRAVAAAYARGASNAELKELLGHGRARRAIHEGDLVNGEIEAGQVCGLIDDIPTAAAVVARMLTEYEQVREWL